MSDDVKAVERFEAIGELRGLLKGARERLGEEKFNDAMKLLARIEENTE